MRKRVKFSSNKEIGILPPGPIDNQIFFDSQGNIKEGLELNKDYRGVNLDVWKLLSSTYKGGPLIVREETDIYSQDMEQEYHKEVLKL